MTAAYQDTVLQAKVFLRKEKNRIKPEDWIRIAEQAREHFSTDRPQNRVFPITGDGTQLYTLTGVLTNWANQFSQLVQVEYPSGDIPPIYLQRKKFDLYNSDSDTEKLMFLDRTPAATETILVSYTAPHVFGAIGVSTIQDQDKMLMALLLAHYAAQAMVSDLLESNKSNLQVDSVDFSQKADNLQKLANQLLKRYADMLDGKTEDVKSYACINQDYDMKTSFGDPYIIHDEEDR